MPNQGEPMEETGAESGEKKEREIEREEEEERKEGRGRRRRGRRTASDWPLWPPDGVVRAGGIAGVKQGHQPLFHGFSKKNP